MPPKSTKRSRVPRRPVRALIERAKHELERMIDMNPRIMLLVGPDLNVLRTNRALLDMLGLDGFDKALGMKIADLFDCGDRTFFDRLIQRPVANGEGEAQVVLRGHGPRRLRFSVIGSPGQTDFRVVFVEDVTQEKAREEEMERLHRKEAIRELAGALMHTINQHLTVISVRAKLLTMAIEKGRLDAEELKQGLDDITGLTMKIAETLSQVGQPKDFPSMTYLDGTEILDLSAGKDTGKPA